MHIHRVLKKYNAKLLKKFQKLEWKDFLNFTKRLEKKLYRLCTISPQTYFILTEELKSIFDGFYRTQICIGRLLNFSRIPESVQTHTLEVTEIYDHYIFRSQNLYSSGKRSEKIERFFGENFMRQVSNEYLTISSSICMRAQKGHLKSIHLSVYEVI